MNITRISAFNFYGTQAAIKNAARKAEEKIVDYNRSAYSVPTGEYPLERMKTKSYAFTPEDNNISSKYIQSKKEIYEPIEDAKDFVLESSIL